MPVFKHNSFFLLFCLMLLTPVLLFAQHGYLMRQKVFNKMDINYGVAVVPQDSGCSLFGDILVDNAYSDILTTYVEDDTLIKNSHTYGGSLSETFNDVLALGDTGFIMVGSAASSDGDLSENNGISDCWLVRLDTNGNILWQKNYGGSGYDRANDIIIMPQGGYVVVGTTRSNDVDVSFNHGESDVWVFGVDNIGNLLWDRSFGGSQSDNGKTVLPVGDSMLMIFASTNSDDGDVKENKGKSDYWLIKYSVTGDSIVWEHTYGDEESDAGADMIAARNGGWLLAGNSRTGESGTRNNGENDYRVIKVDDEGIPIWDHSFGGTMDEIAASIIAADDGYLVSGYAYSNDGDVEGNHGGRDMWIVKLDNGGKLLWQLALGGMYHEVANGATICKDGGYQVVGYAYSIEGDVQGHIERKMDTWTVKLCEDHFIKQLVNICEGEQYEWEGEMYDETGVYEKFFINRCGFDSIRQLRLVVNEYPQSFDIEGEVNPYIGRATIYTAPLNYNNIYHWFVENGTVVDTPAFNKIMIVWGLGGTGLLKAVASSVGGCTSDTAYMEVTIIGESVENNYASIVSVYPVPATDKLSIVGKSIQKVEVHSLDGRLICKYENDGQDKMEISVQNLIDGVYYLRIKTENYMMVKRFIKFSR